VDAWASIMALLRLYYALTYSIMALLRLSLEAPISINVDTVEESELLPRAGRIIAYGGGEGACRSIARCMPRPLSIKFLLKLY
jgi:hypothetical protein